jgi:hypothetical protein
MQHGLLYDAEYNHIMEYATCSQCGTSRLMDRGHCPLEDLFIHYGLIASGDQVMRYGATRERLVKEVDVLCFEMEAAGLMDDFPCISIVADTVVCEYILLVHYCSLLTLLLVVPNGSTMEHPLRSS